MSKLELRSDYRHYRLKNKTKKAENEDMKSRKMINEKKKWSKE